MTVRIVFLLSKYHFDYKEEFIGFSKTVSFLALLRQRRHFLLTFFCCRKKVSACPALGHLENKFKHFLF
jgi:hypothetical protein